MRYREDALTGDIGAPVANDGMMVGTALYALLVGVGICLVGIRSRLIWATLMGGSLSGVSVIYLGAVILGYA